MKIISMVMTVLLMMVIFCANTAFTEGVSAQYMCVIDSVTGRVLYEKNAYTRHSMASTTKIMTAIVALESEKMNTIATVSYKASRVEGSSLYLQSGEKVKVEDLVYGLMLRSGNDAAVVLAEHIGGSVEGFAEMMTAKAKEIGAQNTSFKNPNGLDAEGHYTTAYDLAIITRYAMKNPDFAKVCATKNKVIYTADTNRGIILTNHNKMLRLYEGADGVKTGFTKKTGRCLVSSATRNGWQAICVTLNAPDDWDDHTRMLNAAFNEYQPKKIIEKGQPLATLNIKKGEKQQIRVLASSDVSVPMKAGESAEAQVDCDIPGSAMAPIGGGIIMGKASVSWQGIAIAEVDLITEEGVEKEKPKKFRQNFNDILKNWLLLPVNWSIIE